jgi:Undecaprenyl-phosphate galactose phosphotransferase WbaP
MHNDRVKHLSRVLKSPMSAQKRGAALDRSLCERNSRSEVADRSIRTHHGVSARYERHIICVFFGNSSAFALFKFVSFWRAYAMSAILGTSESRVDISSGFDAEQRPFLPSVVKWRRSLLTTGPLIVADFAAACVALLVVNAALSVLGLTRFSFASADVLSLCTAVVLAQSLFGLYVEGTRAPAVELRSTTAAISSICAAFVLVGTARGDARSFSMLAAWLVCLVSIPTVRWMVRHFLSGREWWGQPVLMYGSGSSAVGMYRALERNRLMGLRPVGLVGVPESAIGDAHGIRVIPWDEASDFVSKQQITTMIVALSDCSEVSSARVIHECCQRVPNCLIVPDLGGVPSLWSTATECGGRLALRSEDNLRRSVPRIVKQVMDYGITALVFIVILPLFALIAALVKLSSPGPIIYARKCLGQHGRYFYYLKFRTMLPNADQALKKYLDEHPEAREEWLRDQKLKNDPRVTPLGRFLRKTSLDELPQLWNVLRGEMSLVGPRPIVDNEIAKYGHLFELRSRVLPGITGLWQVSGRSSTTYAEKIALDTYYVQNWSPWLDLYILISTIRVVLFQEGAV